MARYGFTALNLAVLLALFEIGSCLHCYQCNSETDPACGDPFKSTKHQVDCMTQDSINYNTLYLRSVLPGEVFGSVVGAPRYCHKIVMQTGTVVRTCLDANPADINHTCRSLENSSKLANIDPTKKIKHCSVCDKDNCNAATSLSFSLPLATLALIASYLFCKQ
ncbi:uncharacterized protein LOC110376113 [Helicoverpa armigera]|uniref:Uncharacterized protein n=1 Tax=Helicoverpa armigera TaxID=29058 RepID=A0A2W1BWX5_HELAM|nr:uncharacterized protein LOC110376113 [Helicoverpa armigera]XP_047032370.1 uncharacterized protein LOC124639176 [Helicoverpa zea]PZC78145.1 hypothetical protein B5X24_HaOG202540 [Helicoverpa armigera]